MPLRVTRSSSSSYSDTAWKESYTSLHAIKLHLWLQLDLQPVVDYLTNRQAKRLRHAFHSMFNEGAETALTATLTLQLTLHLCFD